MTPVKFFRGLGQGSKQIPYRKISKDKNLGPMLDIIIETRSRGNVRVPAVIDTATDPPLVLPWDVFNDCGFSGYRDRTTITIPKVMKHHIVVCCSKFDVSLIGRELINRLVLLLHGPRRFFEIK